MPDVSLDNNDKKNNGGVVPLEPNSPPAPPVPSLRFEAFKAIVTSGVAIALTPLAVSLTFFFTATLQSPKPSIEETAVEFYFPGVPLNPSLRDAFGKNPNTAAHLRRAILARTSSSDPDCVSWMKELSWLKSCADKVRAALVEIADEAKAARETPMPRDPKVNQAIARDIEAIEIIESEIDAAQAKNLTDRTGDFEIDVGVYNSGASDGVIKSLATLTVAGKHVTLGSKTWTPVKSHSFANVTFSSSFLSVNGEEAALQDLRDRVKKREALKGVFEINMSDTKTKIEVILPSKENDELAK
ncbi:MAG: hypothetical protein NTZ56_12465 [Acidobacteria bacterium]|nr:hypothetical protein [Acidobacteriota bacterium]